MSSHLPEAYETTLAEDPKRRLRLIGKAWERFVASGEITGRAPRPVIVRSWQQARHLGIDPEAASTPTVLDPEQIRELLARESLGRAGARVLDSFGHMAAAGGHIIVLADAEGRILYCVGERQVQHRLAEVNFRPGGLWAERVAGPNGLGTPLALGSPEVVFGAEHYCQGWQPWVCYGAPVRDAATGRVMGAVDITGPAGTARGGMLALAVSIARNIEQLLALSELRQRDALRSARLDYERRWPREGILLVNAGGGVVEYNALADEMLALQAGRPLSAVLPALWADIERFAAAGQPVETRVSLAGDGRGERSLPCRVLPINGETGPLGFALVLSRGDVPDAARRAPAKRRGAGSAVRFSFAQILGECPRLREALDLAAAAARDRRDVPVLITGESGTGKEMVAHAIHAESTRAARPFVALNCSALPRELVESELFGYMPGAFTGARREGQAGKFEAAHGGTLFLDEIDSMPVEVQAKLLRVLEDREVTPLGSAAAHSVDVRVVAAGSAEMRKRMEQGSFRPDLFYRLSVIEVALPPLRDRGEDVSRIARALLDHECAAADRPVPEWSAEALAQLGAYAWPGNVRELRNLCQRLALTVTGPTVRRTDLPAHLREAQAGGDGTESGLRGLSDALIRRTLEETGGRVGEAARRLGISRTTVYRRRKQWPPR